MSFENHMKFMNIFNPSNFRDEFLKSNSGFGILALLSKGNKWSLNELAYLFVGDPLIKQIALMHYYHKKME